MRSLPFCFSLSYLTLRHFARGFGLHDGVGFLTSIPLWPAALLSCPLITVLVFLTILTVYRGLFKLYPVEWTPGLDEWSFSFIFALLDLQVLAGGAGMLPHGLPGGVRVLPLYRLQYLGVAL